MDGETVLWFGDGHTPDWWVQEEVLFEYFRHVGNGVLGFARARGFWAVELEVFHELGVGREHMGGVFGYAHRGESV